MLKAVLRWGAVGLGVLVFLFAVIQAVPYGRDHSNPPVRQEPTWNSPETRALAVDACFDCHSNQAHWPWYSNVAPVSWWVTNHVDNGRSALNFSEWGAHGGEGASEAAEAVRDGSMPPGYYTWFGLHGDARLTKAEREELASGLTATFGR